MMEENRVREVGIGMRGERGRRGWRRAGGEIWSKSGGRWTADRGRKRKEDK